MTSNTKNNISYTGAIIFGSTMILFLLANIGFYKIGQSDGYYEARYQVTNYLTCISDTKNSIQLCKDTYLKGPW